jgi:hypothetical protein
LKRPLAVFLSLALLGCGKSELQRAQERYDFLKANGATDAELCEEGEKVVEAAADERSEDYELLALTNRIECRSVERKQRRGL